MSFQVKARLVGFLGDTERYPCHACHKVGDEVLYDGEKFIGRLCHDVWPLVAQKVWAMHAAGPRYVEPAHYYPFWHSPLSVSDPDKKKYDGLGFKNVLETVTEPPGHMAHLQPPNISKWPPHDGPLVKDVTVLCPDTRTSALFVLSVVDLSEKGYDTPYFRRQMVILDKLRKNGRLQKGKIIDAFSKKEQEDIYPALSQRLIDRLVEELELMEYVKLEGEVVALTDKGEEKLANFKQGLTEEEVQALDL